MKNNDKIITILFFVALVVVVLLYLAKKRAKAISSSNPDNQGSETIDFGSSSGNTSRPVSSSGGGSVNPIMGVINPWLYLFGGGSSSDTNTTIPPQSNSNFNTVTSGNSNSSVYNNLPSVGRDTMLQVGSKNREVFEMQQLYNARIATPENRSKLVVDGIFGNNTRNAVLYTTNNKKDKMTLSQWNTVTAMTKSVRNNLFK